MIDRSERLRRGETVELSGGGQGKINRKNKTLEISDGRVLRLSGKLERDLIPKDPEAYDYALQYEKTKKGTESGLGKFTHQYMQDSIIGAGRDWIDKARLSAPEYQRKKRASQEVSEEISEKHPWISGAATAANIGTDIAATIGTGGGALGAAAVGGGLALAHAGPRILEEPGHVLGEAGISALGGAAISKIASGAASIAARRGERQALPAAQEAEKLKVKNEKALREHQHKVDLNDYSNRKMQAQNEYKQKVIDRDSEIERIKNEKGTWDAEDKLNIEKRNQEIKRLKEDYALKDQQHKEALRKLPELQRKAQAEHSQNVQKSVNEIVKTIPSETKIKSDLIGVADFIGENITSTAMGGTREAAQVSRVLKSLFPEGEAFTARELGKKYELLEGAIKDSHPAVADYLSRFKEHIAKRIPSIVSDNAVHSKLMPILEKQIEKGIAEAVKKISLGKGAQATRNSIVMMANTNLKRLLQEIGPENFAKKLQTGEIANMLKKGILTADEMLESAGMGNVAKLKKSGQYDLIKKEIKKAHTQFAHEVGNGIDDAIYHNEIKAMESGANINKRLGEALKKTLGMAPPVESPIAPHAPGSAQNPLPSEYAAPPRTATPEPPEVQKTVFTEPRPSPQPPIPEAANSELPPAQGFAQHAGDFLERPLLKGNMGSTDVTQNPIAKLSALKYITGAKMAPIAGAYLGLKGLTSPTAAGAMARMTFRQGGIQAIVSWAQQYPSYHDGVLENPQERRSLTREIEDDPDMPLEQKAIIQSKVNRGKPLEGNLH